MRNQIKFLALAIQLFFVMVLFSSCSLSEDEVTSNDLSCISISTEYLELWEASEASFDEFQGKVSSGEIKVDENNTFEYVEERLKWRKSDPLQRENKFTEFVISNSNSCIWVSNPEKMVEYNSSKKWKKFRN